MAWEAGGNLSPNGRDPLVKDIRVRIEVFGGRRKGENQIKRPPGGVGPNSMGDDSTEFVGDTLLDMSSFTPLKGSREDNAFGDACSSGFGCGWL